ncbi:Gliding motility-associated ABC transporter ATP-binding protein GldA [hydrothermal vent metagenome]|uniref:Gliding motility-associated ABC transporter ATP-binding protein GldA n=1 Tax=hydrothermal vent metagenome TaxID=652676 RepID=A0A3B0WI55_9ZZZZ
MSSLISINNLTRHYGDFCAVNNISFELAAGDILGFLGPNGAGKSSTMQMLSGNLAPTFGAININGIDLLEDPKAAKASLGYLPENPPLYKEMTVIEYLKFCGRLHLIAKSQLDSVCNSAIERCGLTDVKQRLIRNLSKGYQQRVGIAQAILHSPPVIILDEPTVGLDPIQILEIRQLMKTLGENHGIILCTHILPEVQAVCNRVQIINHGELVYNANMVDMLNRKTTKFEISLQADITQAQLSMHDIFTSVETTENKNFLIASNVSAEKLTEYIVQQQWGLTRFAEEQTSLEQIFIDLTLNEKNTTANAA